MIKGVIFDMDGVLIEARDWHYQALNEALNLFGFEITPEMHRQEFDGLPTRIKLEKLTSTENLPIKLHPIINRIKQERTLRIIAAKCYPNPQHIILMSALRRNGIPIGLATNSIYETTKEMLTRAKLIDFFSFITTNEDVRHPKPNPEIYTISCRKLELSPNEVLVIEDNHHGVQSATSAGCEVLRVANPRDVHIQAVNQYFDGRLI
jgi:HAD superfamily hydrolase (TIGR01509 family)